MSTESRQPDSWSEFFEWHHGRLLRYGVHLTVDPLDAEDLIQDVLLKMVRRGSVEQATVAYVLRAMRHRWIDVVRSRAVRPDSQAAALSSADPVGRGDAIDERTARLQRAIAELPIERRELIVLKVHCGLTFREMADLLGRPQGSIASAYARTLHDLRARVTEEMSRG